MLLVAFSGSWGLRVDNYFVCVYAVFKYLVGKDTLNCVNLVLLSNAPNCFSHICVLAARNNCPLGSSSGMAAGQNNVGLSSNYVLGTDNSGHCGVCRPPIEMASGYT